MPKISSTAMTSRFGSQRSGRYISPGGKVVVWRIQADVVTVAYEDTGEIICALPLDALRAALAAVGL